MGRGGGGCSRTHITYTMLSPCMQVFENAAGFLRVRGAVRDAYDDELDASDYYSSSGAGGGKKGHGGTTKVGKSVTLYGVWWWLCLPCVGMQPLYVLISILPYRIVQTANAPEKTKGELAGQHAHPPGVLPHARVGRQGNAFTYIHACIYMPTPPLSIPTAHT